MRHRAIFISLGSFPVDRCRAALGKELGGGGDLGK